MTTILPHPQLPQAGIWIFTSFYSYSLFFAKAIRERCSKRVDQNNLRNPIAAPVRCAILLTLLYVFVHSQLGSEANEWMVNGDRMNIFRMWLPPVVRWGLLSSLTSRHSIKNDNRGLNANKNAEWESGTLVTRTWLSIIRRLRQSGLRVRY